MTARSRQSLTALAAFTAVGIVLAVEIALLSTHVFGAMMRSVDSLLAEDPTWAGDTATPAAAPGPSPLRWLGLVCALAGGALAASFMLIARAGGALGRGLPYRRLLRMAVAAAAGGVLVFVMLSRPLPALGGLGP